MARSVRVNAGHTAIQLPDGGPPRTGPVTVTLTDVQFSLLSPRAFTSGVITDLGILADSDSGTAAENLMNFKTLAALLTPLLVGSIAYDINGAMVSAAVVWPDSTPGLYSAVTVSSVFPGAVDGYSITYGSPVIRTYTQPIITRNSGGAIIGRPAIVVS